MYEWIPSFLNGIDGANFISLCSAFHNVMPLARFRSAGTIKDSSFLFYATMYYVPPGLFVDNHSKTFVSTFPSFKFNKAIC